MRSSCTSAQAWISSSAAIATSTRSASGPDPAPPAPRQPHHANTGRRRLPPPSTNPASVSAELGDVRVEPDELDPATVQEVGEHALDVLRDRVVERGADDGR